MNSKTSKILGLFLILAIGFIIFLARVFDVATSNRYKDLTTKREIDTPLRGDIVTSDGYDIAKSQKRYSISVDPVNIDPNKKELFVKLFSTYSKKSEQEIYSLLTGSDKVVLLSGIDAREAKNFKQLSSVLDKMKVFVPKKVGAKFLRFGLEISENDFFREYPFGDSMQPLLGYVKVENMSGLIGLEKYYESVLTPSQKGVYFGQRDVGGNMIFNEKTKSSFRQDGMSVKLHINLKLQKELEKILDGAKSTLHAESIMACVMETKTGKLRALASSNRYVPYNISKDAIQHMKVDFVQYIYEPGSTIKPIMYAIMLEERKVNINEQIDCRGGKYQVGSKTITDEHKMGLVPSQDAIVFSSNVGMAQMALRLDPYTMSEWLKKFGFEQKSGTDLPYELGGDIPKKQALNSEITRAIMGYGYGMRCNFMQLMAAYNVFNNSGILVTPRLADSVIESDTLKTLPPPGQRRVLGELSASKVKNVLIDVVERGTGVKAKVPYIQIGGKTGTAHIAKNGVYANAYNSSFFGFANDSANHYTIGVLVVEPKGKHFAADTAVPVYKDIVLTLQEDGFLFKSQPAQ